MTVYGIGTSRDCDLFSYVSSLAGSSVDFEFGEAGLEAAITSAGLSVDCDLFTGSGVVSYVGLPPKMADVFKTLLPTGYFWKFKRDDGFDLLLKGMGAAFDKVLPDFKALGNIRNPYETPLLEDLEREFGIVSQAGISVADRRAQLAAIKYAKKGSGSYSYLENMLQAAGFDVCVLPWVPWLTSDTDLYGVEFNLGTDVIVNSQRYDLRVVNLGQLGEPLFQLGEPSCMVGGDMRVFATAHNDVIPTNSTRWPLVFLISALGSSYTERAVDGDMRAETTSAWTAVNGATLSKVGDAYGRVLRVEHHGSSSPGARQTILTPGQCYMVHGTVTRTSGTGTPFVQMGSTTIWTGESVTGEAQEFSVLFLSSSTTITFGATLYPTLEFDNISVTQIVVGAPSIDANRAAMLRTLVLKFKPLRSWGLILNSDFIDPVPPPQ